MKLGKSILSMFLSLVIVLGSVSVVYAQDNEDTIATEIMNLYAEVMVKRDKSVYDSTFVASPEKDFFYSFLDWRLTIMTALDVCYNNFEYTITDISIESMEDSTLLLIEFNEIHEYNNGAGNGSSHGLVMGVEIDTLSEDYNIKNIYLVHDEMYEYFYQQMSKPSVSKMEDNNIIYLEKMIANIYALKDEITEVALTQAENARQAVITENVAPYATQILYSGARGAAYANKYYKNSNSCFYFVNGYDCTNFVSQCIWAGYGGWNATMSDAAMINNISNKVCMTSTWYAGSGGGSAAWESVEALWDYAVGNTGNGPKAFGYNDGGRYTNILPLDICVGDVLQRSPNGIDYVHSMYVISTPGGEAPNYSQIIVAQHTENDTRTLAEVIIIGEYIRHMQFTHNTFD